MHLFSLVFWRRAANFLTYLQAHCIIVLLFFEETGGVLPYWLIILELEKLQKSLEIKKQKRETKKIRNIMEIILFSFFTCMCY